MCINFSIFSTQKKNYELIEIQYNHQFIIKWMKNAKTNTTLRQKINKLMWQEYDWCHSNNIINWMFWITFFLLVTRQFVKPT